MAQMHPQHNKEQKPRMDPYRNGWPMKALMNITQ